MGETEVTQEAYGKVMVFNPSHFNGGSLPAESITWNQAGEYCSKVGMRLPTEAEWEYAALAGSTGTSFGQIDTVAWHDLNSAGRTHPMGEKAANLWGLHDMLGNVFEWTSDPWIPDFFSNSAFVIKGGSWGSLGPDLRASYRLWADSGGHSEFIGVRCVGQLH